MSYFPDRKNFFERAKQGNLVPVWRELVHDHETPLSAYARVRSALDRAGGGARSFLLESVEGGEHIARYSFAGADPRAVFRARGRVVDIHYRDGKSEHFENVDPLDTLRRHMAQYRPVHDPALPRFWGGAVGFIGYDAVAQFDRVPLCDAPESGWNDIEIDIADTLLIFDRVRQTVKVVAAAWMEGNPDRAYDEAVRRIDAMCARLASPLMRTQVDARIPSEGMECQSNVSRQVFEQGVECAREYIRAGDIIQVVLSQRFDTRVQCGAMDLYRALRLINPSPYMFLLDHGARQLIGSSPEIHVRCEGGRVETRPIAGTRPRSAREEEDAAAAQQLLADPKERAEHIMLVDLARNDLGRVCTPGTVRVPELMTIEKYSHVMHIVSHVEGQLSPGRDVYDLMRATFPAGTVSGAPKIRAMEIISEIETSRRGPYAGAVGYFGFDGNLDCCITIRTVTLNDGVASVQAGAGIVADSQPVSEYEETQNKARGMLAAVAMAGRFARAGAGE